MREFIETTLRMAGDITLKYFGSATVEYSKRDINDVVTKADLEANRAIVQAIGDAYPEHSIISEEGGGTEEIGSYVWYVDPLDGTKNFSTHIPLFGVMIALTHGGKVTHSGIYLPVTKELIYAEAGKGVWLGKQRLQGSHVSSLQFSYGLVGARLRMPVAKMIFALAKGSEENLWFNSLGAAAVQAVYLATGRRDWMVSRMTGGLWDYAAPVLIYQELGYAVTDWQGRAWSFTSKDLLAAPPNINKEMVAILRDI